jgi:hypothetical protein
MALVIPSMEYHIAPILPPMRSAHKAQENLNTLELILRKGFGKLTRPTL